MPKKKTVKKVSRVSKVSRVNPQGIMQNQFFGMVLIALGLGALIVVVRYFIISLQVPTSVYEVKYSDLIPGAK